MRMESEKEKKQTELTDQRFLNTGQRRTLHAVQTQLETERRKRKEYDYSIRRIKNDILANFSDPLDYKKLRIAVDKLYKKHVQKEEIRDIDTSDGISDEASAQDRQRLFLEHTGTNLKRKLHDDLQITKSHRMRIMNENSMLTQEINTLREELKLVRGKINDFEIAKQTFDDRNVHSIDAVIQTLNANTGNYGMRNRDKELAATVQANQMEIRRLRQRLATAENSFTSDDQLDENIQDVLLMKLS